MRRLLKHLLALFVACFAASLWAGSIDVWITQESPLQQAFVDALTPALADAGHEIGTIVNSAAVVSPAPSSARVVVALGMNATLSALRQSDATVLATLLSKRDAERVLSEYGTQRLAAIVLDQPVERRLRLLEQLVPDVESVVVLLGNRTASHRGKIEDAIRAAGLAPRIAVINEPAEIVAKLEALLDPQAALLTVPDPEVYNRDTVMGILLTTYRHRRPVIGFTAAYVRAGAVAAVYSDPQDIAMQVVQLLTTAGSLADFPRGILAPSRFRVAINERVSRSLGLPVISELETLERLRAAEAAK
ncbi:MAG: hypothetical protein H6945_19060 [Zoogloeaceae bacterium]|nr:hypothetical protein [Rhodocyclaceae bacterium]MCP5237836.1 hypothetical protein [Zoogloeaceae bacterium]